MKKLSTLFFLSALLLLAAAKFSGAQTPTITTGSVSGSSFCAGSVLSVPFTTSGSFNPGNTFTAELSDASGSFASPVMIGSGTASPLIVTIPSNTPSGTGYLIEVVSSNPVAADISNGINLTINAFAAVTITALSDTICAYVPFTLTATGSSGSLQWQMSDSTGNFDNISGATTTSYTDNNLYESGSFRVIASNGSCSDTSAVFSLYIVYPASLGGISGATSVCTGSSFSYSTSGYFKTYVWNMPSGWILNSGQGTSSVNVTSPSVASSGIIEVAAVNACGVDSQIISVSSFLALVPSVQIYIDSLVTDSVVICHGNSVSFFASPVNGGNNPVYQWMINGVNVGGNSSGLYTDTLSLGDIISCELTSNLSCASTSPVESKSMVVKLLNNIAPVDSIYGNTRVTGATTQTYYVDSIPGANFSWQVPQGWNTVSVNGRSITVKVNNNGTLVVDAYGPCNSSSASLNVIAGPCNAYFYLYPDSLASHYWYAVNLASGVPPITYSWAWGDGTTSPGVTPSHTYTGPGMYDICLTITDSVGCTSTYCDSNQVYRTEGGGPITIQVVLPGTPTNIQAPQLAGAASINVFPNPTNGNVNITATGGESIKEIIVTNVLGQEVSRLIITNNNNTSITLPNANGIYLVHIVGEKGNYISKVMKD